MNPTPTMASPKEASADLGRRLRALRLNASLTGSQVAAAARMSQPKVSRIENGRTVPTPADVARIAEALKADSEVIQGLVAEASALADLSRRWREIHQTGLASTQREAFMTESMATNIAYFHPYLIPGLLQYGPYMRAVLHMANITARPDLEDAVVERLNRQAALHEREKSFQFLMAEPALYARYGSADIMRTQMDLLMSFSRLPTLRLGIIPLTRELPWPLLNGFGLFDDHSVTIETLHGQSILSDRESVNLYHRIFEDLGKVAVYGEHANELLALAQQSYSAKGSSDAKH